MATQTIIPERSRMTQGPIANGTSAQPVQIYLDPDQMRRPEYRVYVFSISKRSFVQPHPVFQNIAIPACPKDKRYIRVFTTSHPTMRPEVDPNNPGGPNILRVENGTRLALSICNPDYVGTDLSIQDKGADLVNQISSSECNLTRQGIFASLNEVPTEEELQKAENRRLAYYRSIFQRMNELWRGDPKKAQDELTIDHHLAAEMFGIDVDWHKLTTPKIECPNCGEKIKEGIHIHFPNGGRCVLDWEKAYLSGHIKKEDVPEVFRWWEEPKIDKRTKEYRDSQKGEQVPG